MKKNLVKSLAFAFLALSIGFTTCKKDDYLEKLKQQEIDDREAYLKAEGITDSSKTASGLYYIETLEGTGVQPVVGDKVKVHYQGQFLKGNIFDSSWERGAPIEFILGVSNVIQGWHEGIAMMKEGGTARLIIPSDLAYGAAGEGSIPAYTTLVFYVKLINDLEEKEIEEREAYLKAENITIESTESGLYYIETEEGTGVQAVAGNVVSVHYEGRFLDGSIFDSSWERGTPIEFILGVSNVIQGWHEGIAMMKEGGTARLVIPSDLAYGAAGEGSIPAYTTLVFYVELVDVE